MNNMVNRNRGALVSAAVVVGAIGCSPIVTQNIYVGQADESLTTFYSENLSEEWRPSDQRRRSRLDQGEVDEFTITVGAGEVIGVLGGCDDDCGALTMQVLDASGQAVASVTESTRHPFISIPPDDPQAYTVRIAMAECRSEPCFASYWVMRSPSEEMTRLYNYYTDALEADWDGIGPLQRGDREALRPEERPWRFLGGQQASVIAACDPNCGGLAIRVLDGQGFPLPLLGLDGDDQRMSVRFEVETSGTYRVDIGMGECRAEACSFAYWVLERRTEDAADDE